MPTIQISKVISKRRGLGLLWQYRPKADLLVSSADALRYDVGLRARPVRVYNAPAVGRPGREPVVDTIGEIRNPNPLSPRHRNVRDFNDGAVRRAVLFECNIRPVRRPRRIPFRRTRPRHRLNIRIRQTNFINRIVAVGVSVVGDKQIGV